MTELGLILGIDLVGLLFALGLWRWLSARDEGGAAFRRLGAALERAAKSLLWRQFRIVAGAALVLGAIVAGLRSHLATAGGALTGSEIAFWIAIGVALGATLGCVCSQAAVALTLRTSIRCAVAAQTSMDRALCLAIRAGGVAGLIAETASAIALIALFGALYAIKGGFALPTVQAVPLALEVTSVLPGFALGAGLAALFIQRSSGTYHAATDAGGDQAAELEAGLSHDDPRNPSSVAELVGDQVGQVAPHTADLLASASLANVAAFVIGAFAAVSTPLASTHPLGLIALPLIVRGFGVVACAFAIMVVRTTEAHDPRLGLLRGHLSAILISLTGIAGAAFWLAREHWLLLLGAGALGIAAAAAVAYLARFRSERRSGPVREALEGLRAGAGATVAVGLGSGLRAVVLPTLVLGTSACCAWHWGTTSGMPSGPALATVIWLMAMLASGPYVVAVGAFGAISDTAAGVVALGARDIEARRRVARLDDAGFSSATAAQTYLIVVSSVCAIVSVLALPILAQGKGEALVLVPYSPILVWCGALGSALVLAHAGGVARAAARGAREIALEVERQLRGFPREHGVAQVPADFTPIYKNCVEIGARTALRRMLLDLSPALLAPIALGFALRILYRGDEARLAVGALTSFVVIAAITGLGAALAIDGARAALGMACRASRPRDGGAGFAQSVAGDAFADIFGNAAGPAARFVTLMLATSALAVAPFLN